MVTSWQEENIKEEKQEQPKLGNNASLSYQSDPVLPIPCGIYASHVILEAQHTPIPDTINQTAAHHAVVSPPAPPPLEVTIPNQPSSTNPPQI